MSNIRIHPALPLGALILASLSAASAFAVDVARNLMSSAAGVCQGALPNYEGNIRKRPLAVVNEGSSDAFVTCAFPGFGGEVHDTYYLYVRNRGSDTITFTCTAVYGSEVEGTPVYVTKSVPRAPGVSGSLFWLPGDGIGTAYPTSVSCLLPPGGAIGNVHTVQFVDVGS